MAGGVAGLVTLGEGVSFTLSADRDFCLHEDVSSSCIILCHGGTATHIYHPEL